MHVHGQDDGCGGHVSPLEIPAAHAVNGGGKMQSTKAAACSRRCICGGH